jgi:formamidopyrimidine-DNA glycosylase
MPELPEVETVRRDLVKFLTGKKIIALKVFSLNTVKTPSTTFSKKLKGATITALKRRGKLLIIELDRPNLFLLIHLKMTGQLIYLSPTVVITGGHTFSEAERKREFPNRHTRVSFTFADGGQLFFNDLRKFGYLKLVDKKSLNEIIANNYGPEPLDKNFSHDLFAASLKKSSRSIKAVLLDQKVIAGLGNIYVDEALFAAGILPDRISKSLKPAEISRLFKAIPEILKKSLKYRGTTFRNYLDGSGRSGNFSKQLQVYGRGGEKCYRCQETLKKIRLAGRGTHYCPKCQK